MVTGTQATKAFLATAVGPSVLHIATHGFFMRDEAPAPPAAISALTSFATRGLDVEESGFSSFATRGLYVEGAGFSSFAMPTPGFDESMKALDRAGLALAGANTHPDGIVTARELAGYDWWGTQLVVLSACETGVGAVPSGEGVYGMRRALVLAGAEAHVVSLWNVDDSSTQQLMRDFYNELARGTGRAEALRQAKLRLLRQPKFVHPYYWAAFIPAGDWTPLEAHVFRRPAGPGAP
jgi:CHAT domain-containing protein